MKTVTFYITNYSITFSNELNIIEQLACNLAIVEWRKWKRVLILCENNSQALKLDKALWKNDINAFVPHNLSGENPCSVPVEICWKKRFCDTSRDILISLLPICAEFSFAFNEVIDFVPNNKFFKKLARDRYRFYRSVGFQLTTATLPTQ